MVLPSTDRENVTAMCCRIDRISTQENVVVLAITGRIREEHVETLRGLLEQEAVPPVLDLQNVMLIDREAVKFLALIEARGCALRNCPPYVREWVTRERTESAGVDHRKSLGGYRTSKMLTRTALHQVLKDKVGSKGNP